MLSVERKLKIAEIITRNGGIKTSDLSSMFKVSEMTILRDLSILEQKGVLKRVYGGAVKIKNSTREISLIIRKNLNPVQKNIIAEKALSYISTGECIFLDGSTTALALARKLAELQVEITVITNGFEIINELKDNPGIKTICPGGELQNSTLSFVGPDAESYLRELFADKCFISASGLSLKSGITVENPVQASIKKIMLKNSIQKIVIIDSTKFGTTRLSKVCEFKDIDIIITDQKPAEKYLDFFRENNIVIIF
jgi:DeoR/GlpR family transcriptional regulator of sugar metabolism